MFTQVSSRADQDITFESIANKWMELKRVEVAASTFEAYKSILHVSLFFINGKKNINQFKPEDILTLRNKILTSPTIEPEM
ncbi:hypothetical protein [Providencia sp.]|uniref:hypothetical protein n=1 Tax=Providencia sp. TaxID=589 RepID=UPI003F976A87